MILTKDNEICKIDNSIVTFTLAYGGTITYYQDPCTLYNYVIHTFNASDNFIVRYPYTLDVSLLIVGSGGDGCDYDGFSGGAGGGGKVIFASQTLKYGTYYATVGRHNASSNYTDYGVSNFNGISASCGQAGTSNISGASGNGYSGGGASYTTIGGGGGGDSSVGYPAGPLLGPDASTYFFRAGYGGSGKKSDISGTILGYGGGGGGGNIYGDSYVQGTTGRGWDGGGNGRASWQPGDTLAQDGRANSGGGAGGGNNDGNHAYGADGVIIIRYKL
jgi:hypothetical protein